jgi:hypothetical protein
MINIKGKNAFIVFILFSRAEAVSLHDHFLNTGQTKEIVDVLMFGLNTFNGSFWALTLQVLTGSFDERIAKGNSQKHKVGSRTHDLMLSRRSGGDLAC